MIRGVKMGKEIVVTAENEAGILARLASVLADRGINMTAISAQAVGGVGLMNFTVDDHLHAVDLLRKKKYNVQENPVILLEVEDRPGVLREITKKLAGKKIDILNIYGSAAATYAGCTLVLSTSHNQKALVLLRGK